MINNMRVLYISSQPKILLLIDASSLVESFGKGEEGCTQGATGLVFPMMISIYLRYHELCI
jgi:hypothetical protein